MPRILLAGLFHETHTFVDERTPLEAFQVSYGRRLLETADDASPLGAVIAAACEYGWTLVPAIDVRATPSGTVDDEVVETFWSGVQTTLDDQTSPPDAVFLVLHGAMVSESFIDVEGEMLRRMRGERGLGRAPIFGVFDLHANFSAAMAAYADCLTPYRENPHTDAAASARRAAALLQRCFRENKRPRLFSQHARIVWPPSGTGTADSPMRDLEAAARVAEASDPNVWDVGIVGGFAFADTPDTGVSFCVTTIGSETSARRHLDELRRRTFALRQAGNQIPPSPADVMRRLCDEHLPGLTVLAEPSDNIGGGAPGDCTELVRAFVEYRLPSALACLNDPQAVQTLASLNVGDRTTLPLGGRGSRLDPGPITLEVELVSRGDGRFTLEDRNSHLASMCGLSFDMGPCAVVKHAGLTLLLTSRKTPPFDLGQWRSQGIEPTRFAVVGVKAAVAHRRAYEPIAARLWAVDTAGPCTSDLRRLPYRRLQRPIFPLDDVKIG